MFSLIIVDMGRSISIARKRVKRKRQKAAKKRLSKKQLYVPFQEEQDSICSWGSPGSPPLKEHEMSPKPIENDKQSEREKNELYGIEKTIHDYDELEKCFELHETRLQGDDLVDFLMKCNRTLADKAHLYQAKYEKAESELWEQDLECKKKLQRVIGFYKKIINSESRSAVMLKKAIQSNVIK